MSSLTVDQEQKWVPTHVQVTVLRARSLRGKGKHGTSDVYTIIQLGKEKYSTCVVEKTTAPEWREECTFELQPGVLESGSPAGGSQLILTVMHQALMGLDLFLGQAVVPLEKVFSESRCLKNEWYQLKSKTGKKEKERGDIQVSVQFTRDHLTASMYDLVMKDKGTSTFGKLKERMRGKRRPSEEDPSSAGLPGGYGSLCRMRQRLPSEGGGEEDYEDDEGGEVRRSKMRTFFLRGKLRKSSDTRSSTSLGSESSESSSRGGSLSPTAGISVVVSDLSNSPSNSSNLTTDNSPEHTANLSPRSPSSLQCEFGDEAGEVSFAVPPPGLCVNGSRASGRPAPGSGKPPASLGPAPLHRSLPVSTSLQNLSPRAFTDAPRGPAGDGRRWSFDKPDEEEKAAIAAALEQGGPVLGGDELDGRLGGADPTAAASEAESGAKKEKRSLSSQGSSAGKGPNQGAEPEQSAAVAEEKHKGWFGSRDLHSKPSLVVSPKVEPSTPLPPAPPPLDAPPSVSPAHPANPFSRPQSTPPAISAGNPFFSLLQQNPFYHHLLAAQPLAPPPPPLPHLSRSRPPISHLFSQTNDPGATPADPGAACRRSLPSGSRNDRMDRAGTGPLPPAPSERFRPSPEPDPQWDDGFEEFAAGRLQPPQGPAHRGSNAAGPGGTRSSLGPGSHGGASLPSPPDTPREVGSETRRTAGRLANANATHADGFPSALAPIPEHNVNLALANPGFPLKSPARTEQDQANGNANVQSLSSANVDPGPHRPPDAKLGSSSPDPASSGIGSSPEEDFLSCPSSYSDKFSASSAEESEPQSSEARKSTSKSRPSGPGEDRWNEGTLFGAERRSGQVPEGSLARWRSPGPTAADLQPKSKDARKREAFHAAVEAFAAAEAALPAPPEVSQPALRIGTSSAEVRRDSAGSPAAGGSVDGLLLPAPRCRHSLSLSSGSQIYQTGESRRPPGSSEPDGTLRSGDSDAPQPGVWLKDGELPAALTDPRRGCQRSLPDRAPRAASGHASSDRPAALQRCLSEGSLPLSPEHPGASPAASPRPPSSSAPPAALCSLPPLANATARSPPSTPPAAAPQPESLESRRRQAADQQHSPHPVKPLLNTTQAEERRTEGRSVLATRLEKLKSTIHPGRSSQPSEQESERKKFVTGGAGSYYHLNHSELVSLLVQREAELKEQKEEFERQKSLLAKREAELKKLKPQVKDLEDYIDTLLVRIMEQKPTLLQVRSKFK